MVKICQTGLLKLNFEIIPKNAFSGFCQKISQAMDEVEICFANFHVLALDITMISKILKNFP
jgi:hypothetical protein